MSLPASVGACTNITKGGKGAAKKGRGGKVNLMFHSGARKGHFFPNRMPPVGVNVVFEGQRCADELILGMSRGA